MIISMLYQLGAVQYKGSLYGQYSHGLVDRITERDSYTPYSCTETSSQ